MYAVILKITFRFPRTLGSVQEIEPRAQEKGLINRAGLVKTLLGCFASYVVEVVFIGLKFIPT